MSRRPKNKRERLRRKREEELSKNLEEKVINIPVYSDENGRFIYYHCDGRGYLPFCDGTRHFGEIWNNRKCVREKCWYYKEIRMNIEDIGKDIKLYIPKEGIFPREVYQLH